MTRGHLGTDDLIANPGITREGYTFMGWSTTQQTETVTTDADGKVGTDTTFYAVWYNDAWLDFNKSDVSATTYEALVEGSTAFWEMPRSQQDDGFVISACYCPTHTNYSYGVIRLPNIDTERLVSISITYKKYAGGSNYFIAHFNENMTGNDYTNDLLLENVADLTTKTFTKDQVVDASNGDRYLTHMYIGAMNYNVQSVLIDKIEIVYAD